jgi:hypothetical protein
MYLQAECGVQIDGQIVDFFVLRYLYTDRRSLWWLGVKHRPSPKWRSPFPRSSNLYHPLIRVIISQMTFAVTPLSQHSA